MNRYYPICLLVPVVALGGCWDTEGGGLFDRIPDGHEWHERIPPEFDGDPPDVCTHFEAEFEIKDRFDQLTDTFVQGEPIHLEARITNISNAPRTLTTSMGCPQVTFQVVAEDNLVLWGSLDGFACIAMAVDVTYAPGETNVFNAAWDQVMRNGRPAPVGDYTVFADDITQCRQTLNRSADLRIQ